MNEADMPKVFVAYCHPGHITHDFHEALLRAAMEGYNHGYVTMLAGAYSGVSIAKNRNKLADVFLNQPEATHMLMCDTDGAWPPSAIAKLLSHDVPIVAGHAMGQDWRSQEPFSAVLMLDEDKVPKRRPYDPEADTGLEMVDVVGMHFCLIKREVIEAIGYGAGRPWAALSMRNKDTMKESWIGEDVTFCLRAKQLGFDTYVDFGCPVGHVKERVMWPPNAGEDPLDKAAAGAVVQDMA